MLSGLVTGVNERGERLSKLRDKTADLDNAAAAFERQARALNERVAAAAADDLSAEELANLVGCDIDVEGRGVASVVRFEKAASVMAHSRHTVRFFATGEEESLVLRRSKAGAIGTPYTLLATKTTTANARRFGGDAAEAERDRGEWDVLEGGGAAAAAGHEGWRRGFRKQPRREPKYLFTIDDRFSCTCWGRDPQSALRATAARCPGGMPGGGAADDPPDDGERRVVYVEV